MWLSTSSSTAAVRVHSKTATRIVDCRGGKDFIWIRVVTVTIEDFQKIGNPWRCCEGYSWDVIIASDLTTRAIEWGLQIQIKKDLHRRRNCGYLGSIGKCISSLPSSCPNTATVESIFTEWARWPEMNVITSAGDHAKLTFFARDRWNERRLRLWATLVRSRQPTWQDWWQRRFHR